MKIALVTGANRGLGLEVSRQLAGKGYTVLMGARDPRKGEVAASRLRAEGLDTRFLELDVSDSASIARAAEKVAREHGRLDVLVNNAGIFVSSDVLTVEMDRILESIRINTLGPYQLCQRFVPMMIRQGHGRVVNVSSGMGQLTEMEGGWPAYRISKAALNAVTRIFAAEAGSGSDVLINSVCPGWVRTDMGGPEAERSIEEGAETIVWLATLPQGGPTGGFFRDREPIAW